MTFPAFTVGSLIALIVLVAAVVLLVTGMVTWPVALIAALAVARLT